MGVVKILSSFMPPPVLHDKLKIYEKIPYAKETLKAPEENIGRSSLPL